MQVTHQATHQVNQLDPRFVTKTMHAYLDYPVAASLIALPFILGLGSSTPAAKWLAVVIGVTAIILTFFTDHKTGVIRILPFSFHVAVDALVGIVFVTAPFVLGFTGLDAWYYWVNGGALLMVLGLAEARSRTDADSERLKCIRITSQAAVEPSTAAAGVFLQRAISEVCCWHETVDQKCPL